MTEKDFWLYPILVTETGQPTEVLWSAGVVASEHIKAHGSTIPVAMANLGVKLQELPEYVALQSLAEKEARQDGEGLV